MQIGTSFKVEFTKTRGLCVPHTYDSQPHNTINVMLSVFECAYTRAHYSERLKNMCTHKIKLMQHLAEQSRIVCSNIITH